MARVVALGALVPMALVAMATMGAGEPASPAGWHASRSLPAQSAIQTPSGGAMTEARFFAALDTSLPRLAAVRAAVEAGDYTAAKSALLAAMRARRKPVTTVNWESWHGPSRVEGWRKPVRQASFDRTVADKICRHVFAGAVISSYPDYEMGPTISWDADPYTSREWTYVLNRHPNWVFLGQAYRATGDEKYAREFTAEVVDWVTRCPRVTDGTHQSSASWRTIEAGIRMLCYWPVAYQEFLHSPSFTPEANYLMMRSMMEHARHLMDNPTGGNWYVMESDGLVHVGTLYPEFREADAWRRKGMARLAQQIDVQCGPDGLQFELSTDYHMTVLTCFSGAMEVQVANGIPVPDTYRSALERLYEAVMHVMKPSGWMPAVNDATAQVEGYPLPATLEPYVTARQEVARGGDLFHRADMRDAAKPTGKPRPPNSGSHGLERCGYYVMRSGWDRDARYLFFDGGPFGAGHQHEDKLNLELAAYGKTLLFDPGCGPYAGTPLRAYCLSSAAHNTILVDGAGQNRRAQARTPDQSRWIPREPLPNPWISTADYDYVSATYDEGYGAGRDRSVAHTRQVLFAKPDYWIVLDNLAGSGRHQADTLWHFRPGQCLTDPVTAACWTANRGEPNLLVLPAAAAGLSLSVATGQANPVRGWISLTCGDARVAAPEAGYRWKGELPARFGWLLYPTRGELGRHPTFALKPIEGGARGHVACRIGHPDGSVDIILLAHGLPGSKRAWGYETDGDLAQVRLGPTGKVLKQVQSGGTYIRAEGRR